ncbi:hypothetical protein HPB51_017243 [Rhipicephalus microplus]|uniref:Bovine pancreatic trypsin inhibitor n=1 Tax=Rhipicephalus microplus TaxID=6941 RepID=A0A9J6EU70_RHIMP|nr:hypothetical protein HPB51_017243 [Rhipicephalus microplus]
MEQPLQKNHARYAGPLPHEIQWAASPYWPAAPVDFWAQSATGQGYPDLSGNEEAEPSAPNSGISAAESSWISNLARMLIFSVLLIALLVTLLLLGRSSTWLAEHDEISGHPEDQQHLSPLAAGVDKGRSSGVRSWMDANFSRPSTAGTKDNAQRRSDTHERTAKTSTQEMDTTEEFTSTLVDMPQKVMHWAKNPKKCGALSFTFCGAPKQEFYFDGFEEACLSIAESKRVALCNRGANKFASLASCDAACGSNANTVEANCIENVLFNECKSQDVNGPLWFFNGDRCERWNFVYGLCPGINDSRASLFETPEECERSCQEPGARNGRCGVPSRVACTPDRLKQPYFANMGASGTAERCLKSSVQSLAGHLCIAGKNRFVSLEACKKTCVGSTRS